MSHFRSVVTTKDLEAGSELFSGYAPTVDGSTFLRLLFKDFLDYLDLDEESPKKTDFLEGMRNDYQKVFNNMINFDLSKYQQAPEKP